MSDTSGDLVAAIEQLTCPSLVDAMGRIHGHRAHLLNLVSPRPERRLLGPAATIAYLPYRDDLPETEVGFADLFQHAVGAQPRGRVLVLSSDGYPEISHGGGISCPACSATISPACWPMVGCATSISSVASGSRPGVGARQPAGAATP